MAWILFVSFYQVGSMKSQTQKPIHDDALSQHFKDVVESFLAAKKPTVLWWSQKSLVLPHFPC